MTRRSSWLSFSLIAAVGAVVVLVNWMSEPLSEPPGPPAATDVQPVSGGWVCPVGDGREGTQLTATVARPLDAGDAPAAVDLEVYEDGERTPTTVPRLFPEAATTRSPTLGEGGAVGATWRDGPATLHREWIVEDDGELPPGMVAGGCVPPLSDEWVIPGMVTSGGSQALLRITNPFPTDATIALRFVGTEGPVAPLALRNLSVEGRSTLEIDVNEYLPERTDLTAIVEVASGRVAAQGVQLVRSAIGGIDGVSVLDAATEPSESWTLPWVVDRPDSRSWLWVYNPGERVAPVELTYHTELGGDLPDGLTEVLVEPGQLRRIDLRGTLPEEDEIVAVTARSDGTPVYVSSAVELGSDEVDRTAFLVQLGIAATDSSWTVSGGSSEGRVEQLHLVNPGSEPVTAQVSLFTGVTVERPDEFHDVTVPAGGRATVVLADAQRELSSWTAFVTTDGGELVVNRVGGAGEGPRRQVSVAGVPSSSWTYQSSDRLLVHTDGLARRLRTSLGLAVGEQAPGTEPEPDPADELPPLEEDVEAPDPDDGPVEDDEPAEPPPDDEPTDDEPTEAADPDDVDEAAEEEDGAPDEEGEAADDEAEGDTDAAPTGDLPGDGPDAGGGDVDPDDDEDAADGDDDDGDETGG